MVNIVKTVIGYMRKDMIAISRHLMTAQAECGDLDAEVAVANPHRSLTFGASASGVATWIEECNGSYLQDGTPLEFHTAHSHSLQIIPPQYPLNSLGKMLGQILIGCHMVPYGARVLIFFESF